MSRQPYGVTTPDQRDQAAEDCDEAAALRDRAGAARDLAAAAREDRAEARLQDAEKYAELTRRLLDAASQEPGADQRIARDLLRHLEESLADADRDRRAATGDRRAAAADRDHAATDRALNAAHRGQAAIERAQQAPGLEPADLEPASLDPVGLEGWAGLYEHAQAARSRAAALTERAREHGAATPPEREVLRRSELARMRAQLGSMPVIEQAKGIIMAQTGCGEAEAFDYLRQASQRLNRPVRDLAAHIVTSLAGTRRPLPRAGQDG